MYILLSEGSVHVERCAAAGHYYALSWPTSHPWCQKHSPPALHLHFKKPAGMRRVPPLPLNISLFLFLSSQAHQQAEPDPCSLISSAPNSILKMSSSCSPSAQLSQVESNTFQWQQRRSHVTLCQRYLHNPHGSTLQSPGGAASCEEHLFNLCLS